LLKLPGEGPKERELVVKFGGAGNGGGSAAAGGASVNVEIIDANPKTIPVKSLYRLHDGMAISSALQLSAELKSARTERRLSCWQTVNNALNSH
jgi:hypothetical protein